LDNGKFFANQYWHRRIKPILSIDLHRIVVHGRTKKKHQPCHVMPPKTIHALHEWDGKLHRPIPTWGALSACHRARRHRRHAAHSAATAAVVVGPHDALAPLVGKAQQATGQIAKAWALTLGFCLTFEIMKS
jgi:hypothetical protein